MNPKGSFIVGIKVNPGKKSAEKIFRLENNGLNLEDVSLS
jgi:hypothetical protein